MANITKSDISLLAQELDKANKYKKMMSRFKEEMNPDMFQATDDPDVWDAVISPEKIKGFQNYLDRLKIEDEKKMLTSDINTYINSNAIDKQVTNYKNKKAKPISKFEYKPHMRPEEKMNDAKSLKGLTPDYGKMPGFKLPTNAKGESTGNYWSADENSDFWKTDAGYQKAQETWGQNLPTFVKKPQRKDIDIAAIKKWFTQSN